jgi:hypothetical protein
VHRASPGKSEASQTVSSTTSSSLSLPSPSSANQTSGLYHQASSSYNNNLEAGQYHQASLGQYQQAVLSSGNRQTSSILEAAQPSGLYPPAFYSFEPHYEQSAEVANLQQQQSSSHPLQYLHHPLVHPGHFKQQFAPQSYVQCNSLQQQQQQQLSAAPFSLYPQSSSTTSSSSSSSQRSHPSSVLCNGCLPTSSSVHQELSPLTAANQAVAEPPSAERNHHSPPTPASPYIVCSQQQQQQQQTLYSVQEDGAEGPPEYQYRAGSLHSLLYSGVEDGAGTAASHNSYALSVIAGIGGSSPSPASSHHNSYALSVMPADSGSGGSEVRHYLDNNNGAAGRCGDFDCGYGEHPLSQQQHPPRQSLLVSGIL